SVVNEPAGPNCTTGGVAVITCADLDGNSTCDASDPVISTEYVCNGIDTLVTSTSLPIGDANCADGGVRLDVGADNGDGGGTAGDGVLQAGEIDSTTYVCNGANGSDGSNGQNGTNGDNSLVKTSPVGAGDATCPEGGFRIDVGLDNGDGGGIAGDGVLQDGEIDATTYVCNGADGSNGTNGTNGANGTDGKNGGCNAGGGDASLGALFAIALLVPRRRKR
ncbi:MAG TPA: hypothetical protein VLT45_14480, partial [Kofleriaceae bacterium]|nr:hypothetical protein [Kofleriaceae bacterium]